MKLGPCLRPPETHSSWSSQQNICWFSGVISRPSTRSTDPMSGNPQTPCHHNRVDAHMGLYGRALLQETKICLIRLQCPSIDKKLMMKYNRLALQPYLQKKLKTLQNK